MKHAFIWLAAALLVSSSTPALAEEADLSSPTAMTAIEFVEMPRHDAPSLSVDGRTLAFLKSQTDWEENRVVQRLHLRDPDTGGVAPAFQVEKEKETHSRAVWSPVSEQFLTALERKDDDHEQAYLFTMTDRSVIRLTEHPTEVEDLTWSPDGSAFYFLAARALDDRTKRLRENDYLIREYETREPKQVWRHDLATGTGSELISGDFFVRDYSLSRDGNAILHLRARGGLIDDIHQGELWLFDVSSGQSRQLTDNEYAERRARLSPDNASFAFVATVNEEGERYYEDNLFVQAVGDPRPRLLMPDEDMEVLDFAWDASGAGLFVLGNVGLRSELFRYDLATDTLRQLTQGDHTITDWRYDHRSDAHVAIVRTQANPGEVHRIEIASDRMADLAALTNTYGDWPKRFVLPSQEAFSYQGRGRQRLEGLLVYPVAHAKGERFPLVTITHGGPRSSSQFGSWNLSRFVAVLAGQGYGVFLPNHRGGTGYGDAFMRDVVGGYFTNAHHDVMDGIDALVERGLADPDGLIKMGWSAGGHMTNKLITGTDRFQAASSGAGASDWLSMYAESDVRYGRTPWFGEAPWVRRAPIRSYRRQSVIQDAWRVTTPTIFHVGGSDVRVPPTQSIMLYRGIKAAGVPTELHIAGGEPHNYRKPSHRLFKIQSDLAWFSRHLGRGKYEPSYPLQALIEKDEDEEDEESETPEEEVPPEPEAMTEMKPGE